MEYKIIHSTTANLESDLGAAAAEGWELFDTPQPHRQPATPEQWLVIMERDENFPVLRSLPSTEDEANGVTLATIRSWADTHEPAVHRSDLSDHARGYDLAVRDVQAILKVHGQPPNVAVHYGS